MQKEHPHPTRLLLVKINIFSIAYRNSEKEKRRILRVLKQLHN